MNLRTQECVDQSPAPTLSQLANVPCIVGRRSVVKIACNLRPTLCACIRAFVILGNNAAQSSTWHLVRQYIVLKLNLSIFRQQLVRHYTVLNCISFDRAGPDPTRNSIGHTGDGGYLGSRDGAGGIAASGEGCFLTRNLGFGHRQLHCASPAAHV